MKSKYRVVADTLEEEIIKGSYNKDKKIPTEEEIGKRFEVSRNTVRKAIEYLVKKGSVYQVQGSGVFIRENEHLCKDNSESKIINLQNMYGLSKDCPGKNIYTKIIDFKLIEADEFLAKKIKCKLGTPIYFVNRVRIIDECIASIEYSYFNKEAIPYLNEEIIQKSIYNYITKDLNLTIGVVDRVVYAEYLSTKDASIYGFEEGSPALINENVAYLTNGQVFDYSRVVLNYKNVKFSFLANLK